MSKFCLIFRINVFATTGITNHIPAINTMLTVSKLRTLRIRSPLHSSSAGGSRIRAPAMQFNFYIPKGESSNTKEKKSMKFDLRILNILFMFD